MWSNYSPVREYGIFICQLNLGQTILELGHVKLDQWGRQYRVHSIIKCMWYSDPLLFWITSFEYEFLQAPSLSSVFCVTKSSEK